jgi:hypothetical protein
MISHIKKAATFAVFLKAKPAYLFAGSISQEKNFTAENVLIAEDEGLRIPK